LHGRVINLSDVAITVGQRSVVKSEAGALLSSSRICGDENDVAILDYTDSSITAQEEERSCARSSTVSTASSVSIGATKIAALVSDLVTRVARSRGCRMVGAIRSGAASGSWSARVVSTAHCGRATFAWCPDLTSGGNNVDGDVVDDRDDGGSVIPSSAGPWVGRGVIRWTGVPSPSDSARGNGLLVAIGIDHPFRDLACLVCAAGRKESGL
jgi:hypothetical protein